MPHFSQFTVTKLIAKTVSPLINVDIASTDPFKCDSPSVSERKPLFSEMKIHMGLKIQSLTHLELYPAIGSECNYQFGNIRMLPMQPKLTMSQLIFLNRLFLDLPIDLRTNDVGVFHLPQYCCRENKCLHLPLVKTS